MKLILRTAVLLYVILILFVCVFAMFFVLNQLDLAKIFDVLNYIQYDENLRIFMASIIGYLVFMNYICFHQVLKANTDEKKVIAFDNPGGRVSVALIAIEDLIKRLVGRFSEVREVRSKVWASKKGLQIKIKLILRAEGSIPEVTSRVQDTVKRKIQDTIGIDEPIEVAIFVGKILSDQGRDKRQQKKEEPPKEQEPNVPFQGYRA